MIAVLALLSYIRIPQTVMRRFPFVQVFFLRIQPIGGLKAPMLTSQSEHLGKVAIDKSRPTRTSVISLKKSLAAQCGMEPMILLATWKA
jgi:hypothetical protein